jgi:outer membrane receptor for ferrienterochelin and colicin
MVLKFCAKVFLNEWAMTKLTCSYVRGEDILTHTNLPQIPPFHGSSEISAFIQQYCTITFSAEFSAPHNNRASGETRSAGYGIFNLHAVSFPIQLYSTSITVRSGIENIFNKSYQNHLSTLRGIIKSEPGKNFYLSMNINI